MPVELTQESIFWQKTRDAAEYHYTRLTDGTLESEAIANGSNPFDWFLESVYYDGRYGLLQLKDYWTSEGDTAFANNCQTWADAAKAVYDTYLQNSNYYAQGHRQFYDGFYKGYQNTGSQTDRNDAYLLSQRAAFARDNTGGNIAQLDVLTGTYDQREISYSLYGYIVNEKMGQPIRPRRDEYIDACISHLEQIFVNQTVNNFKSFMCGIQFKSLITAYEHIESLGQTPDQRIFDTLLVSAEELWNRGWVASDGRFRYTEVVVDEPDWNAPDLNLLICPVYGWLWYRTGDELHRDRFNDAFNNGVSRSTIGQGLTLGKQLNQQLYWGITGLNWAKSTPLTDGGVVEPPPSNENASEGFEPLDSPRALEATIPLNSVILPIKQETYGDFVSRTSGGTIQDYAAQGYNIYAQPAEPTATVEYIVDLGSVIESASILVSWSTQVVAGGSATVSSDISYSTDNVVYTEVQDVNSVFAQNFRYVKINITVDVDDDKTIIELSNISVDVSVSKKSEEGKGTITNANDGVVITFEKSYSDVTKIVVQPFQTGTSKIEEIIDFQDVGNPTSFRVYLTDENGNFITGSFFYEVKGV